MKMPEIKNAVIYKELTLSMKRPKLIILLTILNAVLSLICGITITVFAVVSSEGEVIGYDALLIAFICFIAIEACILAFLIPALTASAISGEREKQTLEVLLTTKMNTWQIVSGKYISSLLSVFLILFSSVPFMALVFIYGGISLIQMISLLLLVLLECMYLASFGVFFSTLTKKTILSTVFTYFVCGAILFGTLGIVIMEFSIVDSINNLYMYQQTQNVTTPLKCGWLSLLLYVNPAVTIFDGICHVIGISEGSAAITGMVDIISELDCSGMSEHNFFLVFWTPLSIIVQGLISFGLLKWSAYLLNPVHGNKKKMARAEAMIAEKKRRREQEWRKAHPEANNLQQPVNNMAQPMQQSAQQPVNNMVQPVQQPAQQPMQQPVQQFPGGNPEGIDHQ